MNNQTRLIANSISKYNVKAGQSYLDHAHRRHIIEKGGAENIKQAQRIAKRAAKR